MRPVVPFGCVLAAAVGMGVGVPLASLASAGVPLALLVASLVSLPTALAQPVSGASAANSDGDDGVDGGDDAIVDEEETIDAMLRAKREQREARRKRDAQELAKIFSPTTGTATWSLSAQTGARGEYATGGYRVATADVKVAADVDLVGAYGRYSSRLTTGGEAKLSAGGDEPPVSLTHRAFVRPWEFGMMRLELDHQFVWQGSPTLASRRDMWRRPYSREDLRVIFTMLHWSFETARLGFQVGRVEEAPTLIWQRDGDEDKRQFELRADWSLFWLDRRAADADGLDMGLNLLAIRQEAIQGDEEATVTEYVWARANAVPLGSLGVPLGSLELYVSAGIGYSEVTPYLRVSGSFGSTTVETTDLPDLTATTGYGRLHGSIGKVAVDAGYQRALYLTFDAELALEDRAHARVELPVPRGRLELGAFAAETTVWSSPERSDTARTGGGSARLNVPIGGGWTLGIDAEVARSFYASLADDARPAPTLGIRGGLTLGKAMGGTRTSAPTE